MGDDRATGSYMLLPGRLRSSDRHNKASRKTPVIARGKRMCPSYFEIRSERYGYKRENSDAKERSERYIPFIQKLYTFHSVGIYLSRETSIPFANKVQSFGKCKPTDQNSRMYETK